MVAWTYDYFANKMDSKQRKEFDESLDRIRYADYYRARDKAERRALVQ